jgi:hypothetical protein
MGTSVAIRKFALSRGRTERIFESFSHTSNHLNLVCLFGCEVRSERDPILQRTSNPAHWLDTLVRAFETSAPAGLKWAFVDRSGSEEHRTMALISWLDAMRTLYLTPSRTGSPLTLIHPDFRAPRYTPEVRANLDSGECTRANAVPITFAEKNRRAQELYGMCVLMKPGSEITSGNFTPADFGRAAQAAR